MLYVVLWVKEMIKGRKSDVLPKAIWLVMGAALVFLSVTGDHIHAIKPEDMASMPPAPKLPYLCEDGKSFTLEVYSQPDCVVLTLDGQPIKLPQIVSGSGARYSNGKTSVWLKGKEAFIVKDGKIIIKNCRVQE
jgi:membrane-bound inhibitor of C-type lysozyme